MIVRFPEVLNLFRKSCKKCSLQAMNTIHEFGPYRLDAEAEMLFRESEPIALGRRAVMLLRLLIERAGTPVSKDALMQAGLAGAGDRGEQTDGADRRTAAGICQRPRGRDLDRDAAPPWLPVCPAARG